MASNGSIKKTILICTAVVLGLIAFPVSVLGIARHFGIPLGSDRVSVLLKNNTAPAEWEETDVTPAADIPVIDQHRLRLIFVMQNDEISGIWLEALNYPGKEVHFFEVPRSTRAELSNELYKELLTYAPTLPQYVKLSKVENHFSKNYRFEALTRILSEATDEKITSWMTVDETLASMWFNKGYANDETNLSSDFFNIFNSVTVNSKSNVDLKTAQVYYEAYADCLFSNDGVLPGTWDKTDYTITTLSARETLEGARY